MSDINEQKKLASELAGKLWAMANDLRGTMEAYESRIIYLDLFSISTYQIRQKRSL